MRNNPPAVAESGLALKHIGFWLVLFVLLYSIANVIRATLAPAGFAGAMGLSFDPSSTSYVYVYALRTAFIAAYGLVLLRARDRRSLAAFAGLATLMPLGDAVVVATEGLGGAFVVKHVVIAGYLMLTAIALSRGWGWHRE